MEDHFIPKKILFGELEQGHRKQGCPCKRYKDTVKVGLKWCNIPPTDLVAIALDKQGWRTLKQIASPSLEEERRHQAQSARERHHLAASIPVTTANFQCPVCALFCKSRIGLQSHSRIHRQRHRQCHPLDRGTTMIMMMMSGSHAHSVFVDSAF